MIVERVAATPHLCASVLRLPEDLRERLVATELVQCVLDELLTGRPVAMLVLQLDGLLTAALLLLVMRAVFLVQRPGDFTGEASLVLALLLLVNCYFIGRNGVTLAIGLRRSLRPQALTVFDCTTHVIIAYAWALMVRGEDSRTGVTFRCVAALSGRGRVRVS